MPDNPRTKEARDDENDDAATKYGTFAGVALDDEENDEPDKHEEREHREDLAPSLDAELAIRLFHLEAVAVILFLFGHAHDPISGPGQRLLIGDHFPGRRDGAGVLRPDELADQMNAFPLVLRRKQIGNFLRHLYRRRRG